MKLSKLLFCAIYFALFNIGNLNAQVYYDAEANQFVDGAELVRVKNGHINYVKWRGDAQIRKNEFTPESLRNLLKLNSNYSFTQKKSEVDKLGFSHFIFDQYFNGILVEESSYRVHFQNERLHSMNGQYHDFNPISTSPSKGFRQCLEVAKNNVAAKTYKWEIPMEEQIIKDIYDDSTKTYLPEEELVIKKNHIDNSYHLAYKMKIYAHEPMSHQLFYIDAQTLQIIEIQNLIHTIDSAGTAATGYIGNQPIVADYTGSNFRLRETGRGGGVETYDMNESTNYGSAVDFIDNDNVWNNINIQQDQYAPDAHLGTELTYDFYYNEFGRNSIDNNGLKLVNYIHYSANYNNAFWDGTRMTYGDGDSVNFYPLTSIDVAAHEMTHGLTSYTADLVYSGESGGLNESFSDIFGNSVESYAKIIDWKMGEDITVTPGVGIRSMSNPKSFNDPDTYQGTFWVPTGGPCNGGNDNCGVHTNSGVQNYWYYLLVNGGSGTNDNSDAYTVTGIGLTDAINIVYRNLTFYLTQNSNYADARFYSIQAAIDLFGDCSQQVISTTDAWFAVGVGAAWTPPAISINFSADPTINCFAPVTVQFTNTTRGANSFLWRFGDGTTSTDANPCHVFNANGVYNVKLIADGAMCSNGTDSLTQNNFIDIAGGNPCNLTMPDNGEGCEQTACNGVLYDNGGSGSNYTDLTTAWLTIQPTAATTVTLNFNSFTYETNWDYLYVYDGNTRNSPLIGTYTGTTLPNGGSVTSTGGAITILSYSDQAVNEAGFDLDWTCVVGLLSNENIEADIDNVNGFANIIWNVKEQNDFKQFEIEKSENNKEFKFIKVVDNTKTSFLDKTYNPDKTYYRIKGEMENGEIIYSRNMEFMPTKTQLFDLYPNPSNGRFVIQKFENNNAFIEIFDLMGKQLSSYILTSKTTEIDLTFLSKGTYLVKMNSEIQRFVIK